MPGTPPCAVLVSCRTAGAWADAALRRPAPPGRPRPGQEAALCSPHRLRRDAEPAAAGLLPGGLLLPEGRPLAAAAGWKFCGLGLIRFCFWIKFPTAPLSIRRWSRPRTTAGAKAVGLGERGAAASSPGTRYTCRRIPDQDALHSLSIRYSHPKWLVKRLPGHSGAGGGGSLPCGRQRPGAADRFR